jgi:hypothetical protein
MSGVQVDLNRIHISLHGVSAELVNEALKGLEAEIGRRLQGVKIANEALSINGISLKPLTLGKSVNAAEMRALLVEQIAMAVKQGTAQGAAQ